MRVLIAGCGYVGTALGLQLSQSGHTVFGLRRDPSHLPSPIRGVGADLRDPDGLATALPRDLDLVAVTVSPDERSAAAYRRAYVEGPATLLDVLEARAAPPRLVAFTSSTAVYGVTDGAWVDEASPTDPSTATGEVLVEAEQAILARPLPAVVVRFAGIYGPGRTRLVDQVRRGEATCPPAPAYTNRIHRDDCAGVLAHVLTLDTAASTYVAADHDPAERCEVLRWLAQRLAAPAPRVGDVQGRRGANKRCRNDRLVGSGYRFVFPTFREGYDDILGG